MPDASPHAEPSPPPLVLSRAQVRALDRAAVEELGIPSIVLMENAAASIERHALQLLNTTDSPKPPPPQHHIVIFCGPGNNGGDGYALARRLHVHASCHRAPFEVTVVSMAAPASADAAINDAIMRRMGIPLIDHDPQHPEATDEAINARIGDVTRLLLVDALLGTGLTRPLVGTILRGVQTINALRRRIEHTRVLAVDIPTGLDCDTGEPTSESEPRAVAADLTVTLAGVKRGFLNTRASTYTGQIEVGGIGLTRSFTARFAEGSPPASGAPSGNPDMPKRRPTSPNAAPRAG